MAYCFSSLRTRRRKNSPATQYVGNEPGKARRKRKQGSRGGLVHQFCGRFSVERRGPATQPCLCPHLEPQGSAQGHRVGQGSGRRRRAMTDRRAS